MYKMHTCMYIYVCIKEHTIYKPQKKWDWGHKEQRCQMKEDIFICNFYIHDMYPFFK